MSHREIMLIYRLFVDIEPLGIVLQIKINRLDRLPMLKSCTSDDCEFKKVLMF